MRGEHLRYRRDVSHDARIIPACAGNTDAIDGDEIFRAGSSPLARGTPIDMSFAGLQQRIIPACAGNTWRGTVMSTRE